MDRQGQISNFIPLVVVFLILCFSIFQFNFSLLIVVLSVAVFVIAFLHIDFALFILLFSMLLSPELPLGAISGRQIVIRIDDILLMVILMGWLAKTAVNKEEALFKFTKLNKPIVIYLLIGALATLFGVLRGFAQFKVSTFYFMKYVEYFLLFFMVTNSLKSMKQIKVFVFVVLFIAFLVSLYACILHFQGVERVTAPFEGTEGEANTLGGYLILIISIVIGLFLNLPSLKSKFFLLCVLLCALPALLFTLSRGSWLGFIPAIITIIVLTRRGKFILLFASLLVILFSSSIFPHYFRERINYTFSQGKRYTFMGKHVQLEESAAARVEVMKFALQKWTKEPLLGYGVGSSIPVIDNQYARVLIEVGLIGFLIFWWVLAMVFMNAYKSLRVLKENNFATGLIIGFIAGLVGLLAHALTAETFILIRIMEPFWFLAAVVMVLPQVQRLEATMNTSAPMGEQ